MFYIVLFLYTIGLSKGQVPWWEIPSFYLNTTTPVTTLRLALQNAAQNDPGLPATFDYAASADACVNVVFYAPTVLNPEERGAIRCYTNPESRGISIFGRVNIALRERNTNLLRAWSPYLKLYHTAVEKLPRIEGVYYRGIPLDVYRDHTVNSLVTLDISWTRNANVAPIFAGQGATPGTLPQSCTLAVLFATSARLISYYSAIVDEEEFAMLPGTLALVLLMVDPTPTTCRVVFLGEADSKKVPHNTTLVTNLLNDKLNSTQIQRYNQFMRDYYNKSLTVRINKTQAVNITTRGGSDHPYDRWPYITRITYSAAAPPSGLNVGQILVRVNDNSTRGMTENQVSALIDNAVRDTQKYTDYTVAYR